MKKKFWTGRLKTILIVALIVAICAAVTLAITSGTSAIENVVGTILSPIRAGVASIDRLAERYYNYMFRYETLEAENAEMEKQILAMQEDIRDAEQLQRENEWLKALLNLSDEHEDYKFLTSYIISWDSSDYKSAFTIGKGTNRFADHTSCFKIQPAMKVVGTNFTEISAQCKRKIKRGYKSRLLFFLPITSDAASQHQSSDILFYHSILFFTSGKCTLFQLNYEISRKNDAIRD